MSQDDGKTGKGGHGNRSGRRRSRKDPAMADRPCDGARPRTGRVPRRDPLFAGVSLPNLRAYRQNITAEETRVSYWRRLVQVRLDMVRAGTTVPVVDVEHLRAVLARNPVDSGRRALVEVIAVDDVPPLPDLGALWNRDPVPFDDAANAILESDLADAEAQLSAYRATLHRRLAAATGELIARYREDPSLCLSVLPLGPRRRALGA